jgi:hypothetical protein
MSVQQGKKTEDIEKIEYEERPGFRQAFYLVLGLSIFWLFYLFNTAGAH